MPFIAPIVEGHGEQEALEALLHRIAHKLGVAGQLRINPPIRIRAGQFINDAEQFRRYLLLAAAKAAQSSGAVLILLDCDLKGTAGCAAELGPRLLAQAMALRPDVPMLVVLAEREFESWFLAAARSLQGRHGLSEDFAAPPNHARRRDAKGILHAAMKDGYDPILHQAKLARAMDLEEAAQGNRSFGRMVERLARLWRAAE